MATMSKQHYEHLARTLGDAVAVEACEGGGEGSRAAGAAYRVALAVADSLADTNPAYDGTRFLDAVDGHTALTAQHLARDGEGVGYSYAARRCVEDALAQRGKGSRF